MRRPLRFLFSGYFVSAMLIVTEVILIFWLALELSYYSVYFLLGALLISLLSVVAVINANYNPEYKVTWICVICFLPLFGTLLFILFRRKKMSRRDSRMARRTIEELDAFSDLDAEGKLDERDPAAMGKARAILSNSPTSDLYTNTSSDFYAHGEDMYEAMIADLKGAKEFIFMEYFIIDDGEMWAGIHDILRQKAASGVEVRILYDDVGCMSTLPRGFTRKLTSEGIKVACFGRVSPRISSAHNNRDHRKILVIDGKVGYTGGMNIADEYINKINRFGNWKDGGIRLKGEGVGGLCKLFLFSWDMTVRSHSDYAAYLGKCKGTCEPGDGGYYMVFGSGPLPIYPIHVGERAFLDIINCAERYLYITTPYLIIGYDLTEALCGAARRGVDVRIITPGSADKQLVKLMTKSAYPHLMEAGVKIYEYAPGFIHEKTLVCDDRYGMSGTINFDYRSLIHHYEDAVWVYNSPTVPRMREELEITLTQSTRMTRKKARLTVKEWAVRCLIRLFAPLL